MLKMLKNKAGYVSIEAIVVVVLMLGLAVYAFSAFQETGQGLIDAADAKAAEALGTIVD